MQWLQNTVEKRLIPKIGHVKLKKINPRMLSQYYNELLKEGLTEEFIQYIHSIHKMASTPAVDWNYKKMIS
ncbi:hypothetical protein ACTHO0_03665 [Cytobacillus praedii]|uniref:hypothetical protein n=1 Tax=Cytobacillus praedii TaxID=1742358 RepID=UPI003F7CF82C